MSLFPRKECVDLGLKYSESLETGKKKKFKDTARWGPAGAEAEQEKKHLPDPKQKQILEWERERKWA